MLFRSGGIVNKWTGQCPSCGQWNTLVETIIEGIGSRVFNQRQGIAQTAPVMTLADIEAIDVPRFGTGIEEFDRVLGGGLVAGTALAVRALAPAARAWSAVGGALVVSVTNLIVSAAMRGGGDGGSRPAGLGPAAGGGGAAAAPEAP